MAAKKRKLDPEERAEILAEVERLRAQRDAGYREQALKLFPHVCGRCGRAFEGKRLRELTVHHRDHNHMNNPPDGSNWELLCIYCHDAEHQTPEQREQRDRPPLGIDADDRLTFNAFEGLKDLFPLDDVREPPGEAEGPR